jgi:hypothetical protein
MKGLMRFLDRLLPALLIASSVTLLAAGLLSYAPPPSETGVPSDEPSVEDPLFPATPDGVANAPTPSPSVAATPDCPAFVPCPTVPPPTAPPSTEPTAVPPTAPPPGTGPFATRIVIPSLSIDLPVVPGDLVVKGNKNFYPLCDVAMYMPSFVQPGQPGSTYIYGHAQRGMFAPLLKNSQINDGAGMVGALVEVYTSDNMLHLYELYRVKRHALDLSLATNVDPGEHRLVLQTSEGVTGTVPKLQVAARPLSVVPSTPQEAQPTPHPRVCLPRSGPYA